MAENSKIEWTTHTFNPWFGCTKVSPACKNCYAESLTKRTGLVVWGPQAERRVSSEANWKQPLKWAARLRKINSRRSKWSEPAIREKVFCASLADVFEDRPEVVESRLRLWALIKETPELDWLLLTKRPENISGMLPGSWGNGWANVWLGTTVEDQQRADERIPHLLRTPAAKRFLSVEPMLGPVDVLMSLIGGCGNSECIRIGCCRIDWVICGSESGRGARECDLEWVRSLCDQCVSSGVPFFWKQHIVSGKKISTPELDGKTWTEFPQIIA